jgi:FtsH-binding integral membrane protein
LGQSRLIERKNMNLNVSAAESLNTAVAGVLGRMSIGIFATMIFASIVVGLGIVPLLFSGILGYVIIFAPLVMSLFLAWKGSEMSESTIKLWFFAFAAAMGLSLSLLFYAYTSASIVTALFGTTVSFGALAGWGYFTKRDISGWGPFLFAGVIGLIVASIVNIFVASTALQMTLNVLCILIFLGLTAYDMNRIRDMFWSASEDEIRRMQWFGALSLYINFINIFTSLLQLLGNRE